MATPGAIFGAAPVLVALQSRWRCVRKFGRHGWPNCLRTHAPMYGTRRSSVLPRAAAVAVASARTCAVAAAAAAARRAYLHCTALHCAALREALAWLPCCPAGPRAAPHPSPPGIGASRPRGAGGAPGPPSTPSLAGTAVDLAASHHRLHPVLFYLSYLMWCTLTLTLHTGEACTACTAHSPLMAAVRACVCACVRVWWVLA